MQSPVLYNEGIVYYRIAKNDVSLPEALELSREVTTLIKDVGAKVLIADTRNVLAELPADVDRVFIDMYRNLPGHVERCVAICHDAVTKLETNYIFKKVGAEDRFKAFVVEDEPEAKAFAGVENLLFT